MTKHKSFEAWQEAHAVVNFALDLARDHWKPYLAPLYSQLTRAALSAQINLSEGYGFGSSRKFVHHLMIAKGSAAEAGDLLELLVERGEVAAVEGNLAFERCRRCQRLLFGLIKKYQATPS